MHAGRTFGKVDGVAGAAGSAAGRTSMEVVVGVAASVIADAFDAAKGPG